MWVELTRNISVPVALHLDHCPDREVISECLAKGWNSVLFDASKLSVEDNRRQCIEVVAEARRYGAAVEGEIEGIRGVEDGIGSDDASTIQSLDVALDFIRSTLDNQRVSDIVAAAPIPIALHGGTGMAPEQFSDLIARGCAKVNISTALKVRFMQSGYDFMTDHAGEFDPPSLFRAQRTAVMDMASDHIRLFGSEGKAW